MREAPDYVRKPSAWIGAAAEADRGELVTRGEFYRALWIQGAGIVAILGALHFLPI